MNIFIELAAVIFIATLVATVMRILKQPLTVGYIFTGILAGPYVFNILQSTEHIELFSKIGITVLLFIVGLNLSPQVIKEIGKSSLFIGLGQIVITALIAYYFAAILRIPTLPSLYLALALTFSSTIIVLKILSDMGDLQRLYGKISIGLLIIQDIVVSIILLFIATNSNTVSTNPYISVGIFLGKALLLLLILYAVSMFILPKISHFMATSQELLFLFSVAWGLGLASFFYISGFSVEIGALLAGITLSFTPYAHEIGSRMKPLRDFFLILFFILLGSQTKLGNIPMMIIPVSLFTIFVLIYKPIIVFVIMNLLGFKRKTSYHTGLTVSQISEFSLILAAIGFNQGVITQDIFSMITIVGLLSMTGSTYLMLYADKIFTYIGPYLRYLEIRKKTKQETNKNDSHEILLFGFNKIGKHFIHAFNKMGSPFLVIDFDPESIHYLREQGIAHRFGDAEDVEFLQELNLEKVKMVISIITDFKTNLLLTKQIREAHPKAIIIILSDDIHHAQELYKAGATYVVMPHFLGAQYTANMITKFGLKNDSFREEREKHLEHLQRKIER